MYTRRKFLQQSATLGFVVCWDAAFGRFELVDTHFHYQSEFLKATLNGNRPEFLFLSTDSLGKGALENSPLMAGQKSGGQYTSKATKRKIGYYYNRPPKKKPDWEITFNRKGFLIHSRYSEHGSDLSPFVLNFSQQKNHSTVLGLMAEKNYVAFPCVLHMPGMGTFEITCSKPEQKLYYDAGRNVDEPFVRIEFAAATKDHPEITYELASKLIYPENDYIQNDPAFDGFRRNFINIFQLNPTIRALANNSASDACAFTVYKYAELARYAPRLTANFTAMDLVRQTLDRYMTGMLAYGQVGYGTWKSKFDALDSMPSLLMAACYYIKETEDKAWGHRNHGTLMEWAQKIMANDTDNDGIISYGYSGNSDSWKNFGELTRPSNWWDTIGFGHDDAYANALAYRACTLLLDVNRLLEVADDGEVGAFTNKLKQNYVSRFLNKETGVIAGWRSKDGNLHDYYFLFVNSVAICYGLIERPLAIQIMTILLKKMKEVGFTDFRLGLPGNLIPIRREDYVHFEKRWGYGELEDGSDGFQIYENGGATACYSYFTIQALCMVGMVDEAKKILFPMLESFRFNQFEGNCPGSDKTRDWKTWNGECWGYEGFLVDSYLTFLALSNSELVK